MSRKSEMKRCRKKAAEAEKERRYKADEYGEKPGHNWYLRRGRNWIYTWQMIIEFFNRSEAYNCEELKTYAEIDYGLKQNQLLAAKGLHGRPAYLGASHYLRAIKSLYNLCPKLYNKFEAWYRIPYNEDAKIIDDISNREYAMWKEYESMLGEELYTQAYWNVHAGRESGVRFF